MEWVVWMLEAGYRDVFVDLLPRRVLVGRGARHGGIGRKPAYLKMCKR